MEVLSELVNLTEADKTTLCEMNFRLGRAFHSIGDLTASTKYLTQFLDSCNENSHKSREGEAKVYLASCYEKAGNLELAATHLQQYITAAEKDLFQRSETSTACKQLGNLFGILNNHEESVVYYDKHYAITTELLAEANVVHLKLLSTPASNDINQQTIKKYANTLKNQELLVHECSTKAELARILLGIARGNSQMANLFGMVGDDLYGVQNLISWKSGANGIKLLSPETEDIHDFSAIEFEQQQKIIA
jgi:tetratricopeptide (TPR) repeat protein